ncbi:MAG: hypothetical protein EOL95_03250 [Bacteroidia bacterium]|nr:hypothetical protein [Bacteroidia bacterium]
MMRVFVMVVLSFTIIVMSVSAQTAIKKQSVRHNDDPNIRQTEVFQSYVNENDTTQYKNHYLFERVYNRLNNMLIGKEPISFKKAVFLVENAYYGGKLSWNDYDKELKRIKQVLDRVIVDRRLQSQRTAGNYAIFTFMTDSIAENNNCPYKYDYETFVKDGGQEAGMVTRLLKTKKGNCHSLPYMYKILANDMKVEACLALAPMHVYVKHKDENGKWWNLELTSGTFSRSSFIMESFNVSEQAIESGLFMKGLSEKESIALCLYDLLNIYESKTGIYSNDFVRKCYKLGLRYFPVSQLQNWKFGDLKYQLDKKMAKLGMNNYRQIVDNPQLENLFYQMDTTNKYITKIGYSTITTEQYREKASSIIDYRKKN